MSRLKSTGDSLRTLAAFTLNKSAKAAIGSFIGGLIIISVSWRAPETPAADLFWQVFFAIRPSPIQWPFRVADLYPLRHRQAIVRLQYPAAHQHSRHRIPLLWSKSRCREP